MLHWFYFTHWDTRWPLKKVRERKLLFLSFLFLFSIISPKKHHYCTNLISCSYNVPHPWCRGSWTHCYICHLRFPRSSLYPPAAFTTSKRSFERAVWKLIVSKCRLHLALWYVRTKAANSRCERINSCRNLVHFVTIWEVYSPHAIKLIRFSGYDRLLPSFLQTQIL